MALPRVVPRSAVDPSNTEGLRNEVRQFLAGQVAAGAFTPAVDAWLCGWDVDFTAKLAIDRKLADERIGEFMRSSL